MTARLLAAPQLQVTSAVVAAALTWLFARHKRGHEVEVDPVEVQPGLLMRRLHVGDNRKGFFELLSQLTEAPSRSSAEYRRTYRRIGHRGEHCILVIEDTSKQRLVATASLLFEQKFIRGCGVVAHIEDVVVDVQYRGLRLGKHLIAALTRIARGFGCYKAILDCSEDNVGFYISCDFDQKGVMMAQYF
jgi:glucosamine-phosphate N-acetyltransferase